MQPEIEAKFVNADHERVRAALEGLGAKCAHPMRITKRKNYDFPDGRLAKKSGWVRLRDEGDKITLSYKQLNNRQLDGTHEVVVVVDSLDAAEAFLKAIGLVQSNYHETKRESWRLDGCEIELDEWPWIKPFIEIEGPDEQSLKHIAQQLDLDWGKVLHGSVEIAYRTEYNVTDEEINQIPAITFDVPVPDWLEKRRRA